MAVNSFPENYYVNHVEVFKVITDNGDGTYNLQRVRSNNGAIGDTFSNVGFLTGHGTKLTANDNILAGVFFEGDDLSTVVVKIVNAAFVAT